MANFTLNWTPNINSNVSSQQAEYRRRSVGGVYNSSGFIPGNPLLTTDNTTSISGLLDNVVYEFRISNFCTEGRTYTANSEAIKFGCVTPTEAHTDTNITATVSSLPSDITKVRFSLLNFDGSSLLQGPIVVNTSAGSCPNIFNSLTPDTTYIIRVEFVALINGVEVTSTLNTCQVSVTTNLPGDMFLINGSDSMLINGSDTLTI